MLFPQRPDDISPALLNELAAQHRSGVIIENVVVIDVKDSGSTAASSSALVTIKVDYANGSVHGLPEHLLVKTTQSDSSLWYSNLRALYANELSFYEKLRPELHFEAPVSLGGAMREDGLYVLAIEDVRKRGAKFHTVLTDDVTAEHAYNVLDTLARLHATYWDTPRFNSDLNWLQTHVDGELETFLREQTSQSNELNISRYKREILGILNLTETQLHNYSIAVNEHQSRLPNTIVHGDPHLGNIYFLPDRKAGLIDFQCVVKGHAAHDIGYFINVALPVEVRRREERNLLDFYREKLIEYGVKEAPDRETLWLEYRRSIIWGIYPAWLPVPAENYGMEHTAVVLLRLVAAFQDHDGAKLLAELTA